MVPTLVLGVYTDQIGDIIGFVLLALHGLPAVRGVHFQPISYFGSYPVLLGDKDRITLSKVLKAIVEQTGGMLKTG